MQGPGDPDQLVPQSSQCVRCGACTSVCPVYRARPRESLTARGRLHLLASGEEVQPSSHLQDLLARCLLCGACEAACPRNLPIISLTREARASCAVLAGGHGLFKWLVRKSLAYPGLLEGLVRSGISLKKLHLLPADSGLRLRLGLVEERSRDTQRFSGTGAAFLPNSVSCPQNLVYYFSGCLAGHLQPSIGEATATVVKRLSGASLIQAGGQGCCGLAASSAGDPDEARRLAKGNIAAFPEEGVILTSCASCFAHLRTYPTLFAGDREWEARAIRFAERVREFAEYALEALGERELGSQAPSKLVHYHEPCHLRFLQSAIVREGPKRLLDRIANLERVTLPAHCCGQGGLFHLGYPDLSRRIFDRCAQPLIEQTEPAIDLVTTTCSGCLMQWQLHAAGLARPPRIEHLAILLRQYLQ